MHFYDTRTYLPNPVVKANTLRTKSRDISPITEYKDCKRQLPALEGLSRSSCSCWDFCWKGMLDHRIEATEENGFLSEAVDTVFNGSVFLWDTVMTLQYAKYGSNAFDLTGSLDNFYARQHPDGFICREVRATDGHESWHRHDPSSTGPDIFAWGEWDIYRLTGDTERLRLILPALIGYFYWLRAYRRNPDGTRFHSGWGSGIDNQPRGKAVTLPGGISPDEIPVEYYWFTPAAMSWIDATAQALLAAQTILRMIDETDSCQEHRGLIATEERLLRDVIHTKMYNEKTGFYSDLHGDGTVSDVKTLAAFWVLLTEGVPQERVDSMVSALEDPEQFKRPHMVPTLSADHPAYRADGDYWNGGVWPPTTYLVLRALRTQGYHELAFRIAKNHYDAVLEVYEQTGTVWENYAPETITPGGLSKPDMLGWSGLGPIAVLTEFLCGIEIDIPKGNVGIVSSHISDYRLENLSVGDHKRLSVISTAGKVSIETDYEGPLAIKTIGTQE